MSKDPLGWACISCRQCYFDLDTDHMAFLGSFLKSGFFMTYWDLYPIKYQHNTLSFGIQNVFFFLI